jgi:3-hydroxybutyryl-CoA dehydrogenase
VLVCGAGLMGHGIAQVFAAAGYPVTLYEPDLARAQAGRERIAGSLDRAVAKGRLAPDAREAQLARIWVSADLARAADGAALVVEAVFEDEGVKRALLTELDRLSPSAAVLASNTSSISITRLASAVAPARRARVVGMHFFSPVPVMPLVELVRGADTDDATEAAVRGWAAAIGKQVIVSRDSPGFIVNRILMPYLAEAMRAYAARAGRLHRPGRLSAHHGGAARGLRGAPHGPSGGAARACRGRPARPEDRPWLLYLPAIEHGVD